MEIEVKIPPFGESVTEVTIASWTKSDGDTVAQDEVIAEIESDKASFELTAEQAGTLKILVKEDTTVPIGEKIATINTDGAAKPAEPAKEEPAKAEPAEPAQPAKPTEAAKPTPQPQAVKEEPKAAPAPAPAPKPQEAPKPAQPAAPKPPQINLDGNRNDRREKMSTLRKTIAKRLVEAKNQTAMLTTFNEVDMGAIMDMRKKYKDTFKEKYGIGLGFMSLFAKAVCEAVKDFPAVNARIEDTDLIYHDYVDMGIAVSTPRGLVVPVIRNIETMSLADIEKAVLDLATRARDNKLSIDEMTGGTFTITNGGVFGSMLSTPILNAPQSGILGMHNIVDRPVAKDGQVVIRPIMYVALSYDHRVIDGRESVGFLVKVKQMLEDPYRMLLDV